MDTLHQQIARARRRLVMEQFLSIATRTLLVAVIVAAIAVIVPKLWSLGLSARGMQIWYAAWLSSGLVLGGIVGAVWTLIVRRSELDAAIEVDHRFGLKERISSALALGEQDRETPAGQALMSDAVRKAGRIDIKEQFRLKASPWLVLPPALWVLALLAALLLPNAIPKQVSAEEQAVEAAQVKAAVEELQKRIEEQRDRAAEAGLEDAENLLAELEERTEEMANVEEAERREAQIELNNLREEIENRRDELGAGEELQRQLQELGDLDEGPADELADAMQEGDFEEAQERLEALMEELANGDLTPEEQEAMANQMQQLADRIQEAVDAHEKAKQELDEQIAQAEAAGDTQRAQQLQQQRDSLAQQDAQMNRMQNLADSMSQCSQCMREGNGEGAAQQMAQLGQQIDQLAQEAAEMELLEGALDQMAQARDAMNCQQCQGQGCQACQGQGQQPGQGGQGNQLSQRPGQGMGAGRGQGDRPESDTATGTYDSQVAPNIQQGSAVVTGDADGANRKVEAQVAIREAYESVVGDDSDPLAGQRVPRGDREYLQEYFDRLRDGELEADSGEPLD